MENLAFLSKKYNFKYGFVTDFSDELVYDKNKLSRIAVVGNDPTKVKSDCKTVVVVIFGHAVNNFENNIASFACEEDYHHKIYRILNVLEDNSAKVIVDGNDLNERYFAAKSGLGFIGKNSMFISEEFGSFCNIALILTNKVFQASTPIKSKCGSCKICENVCPVNALEEGQVNCKKCISEQLQTRDNLKNFENQKNHVYGCDACQQYCPFNKEVNSSKDDILNIDLDENLFLTKKEFKAKYETSAFYWIGYRTFLRNVHVAYINQTGKYDALEFLNQSNSVYLKEVYRKLMEDKDG